MRGIRRRAPPAARRAPRRALGLRVARRRLRGRPGSAHAAGSASSSSSAASAASAASISRSRRSARRRCVLRCGGPPGRRRRLGLRRGRLAAACACSPASRSRPRALLAHAQVLRPAAVVAAQRAVLDGDRARADGVEQRAVVRDEQRREPWKRCSASSSASRLSRSRWLVGSSRISTLAPECDEDRERQPPALAARQAVERLLGVLAARTGSGRAARAPCSASARSRAGAASSTVRRSRRAPRRAGRGSRP